MSHHHFELETTVEGWAVYAGCNGEVADFVGFFLDLASAERVIDALDPDDDGEPLFFDAMAVPALLTRFGILTADDYTITHPAQLRVAFLKHTKIEPTLADLEADLG